MSFYQASDPVQDSIPIACNLQVLDPAQRAAHQARVTTLFQAAVQERQALPDGMAFRVDATDYELVTAFIAQERRCCSFFRFMLDLAPNNGPIWLRITGSPDAVAVLSNGLDTVLAAAGGH